MGGYCHFLPSLFFKYNTMDRIKIGDWIEALIYVITFGYGERIALWVAKTFFNSHSCGCCERREWLNKLTNPSYDGECKGIKL